MIRNILLICTGNICRSPMAEGLMRQKLPEMMVYSAGLHALNGASVDRMAVDSVWNRGIDIRGHRARKIGVWMIEEADLVLTMDRAQKHEIKVRYPGFKNKVWRLGEYSNFDVPDPYQKECQAFLDALSLISQGIDDWSAYLRSFNSNNTGEFQLATAP